MVIFLKKIKGKTNVASLFIEHVFNTHLLYTNNNMIASRPLPRQALRRNKGHLDDSQTNRRNHVRDRVEKAFSYVVPTTDDSSAAEGENEKHHRRTILEEENKDSEEIVWGFTLKEEAEEEEGDGGSNSNEPMSLTACTLNPCTGGSSCIIHNKESVYCSCPDTTDIAGGYILGFLNEAYCPKSNDDITLLNNIVNNPSKYLLYIDLSSSTSLCEDNPCRNDVECLPFGVPYCRYNCDDGRDYIPFNETCPIKIDDASSRIQHSIMSWRLSPAATTEEGGFFANDNTKYLYLLILVPAIILVFCLCCCRKRTPRNPPSEKKKASAADEKSSSETENE